MPRRDRTLAGALAFALCTALPGCGYALSGRGSYLPAYIKVIGIPTFTNQTSVYDVERRITSAVQAEFIGRGKYKVLPETTGVDAVLTGEILSITLAPSAFNAERQATRYALTLTARIEFRDLKADKVLWSNPALQFREEYEVSNSEIALDPALFLGQDMNALDRIAQEFARTVVSAILEAF